MIANHAYNRRHHHFNLISGLNHNRLVVISLIQFFNNSATDQTENSFFFSLLMANLLLE